MNAVSELRRRGRPWISLAAFVATSLAVQLAGGFLTSLSVKTWYSGLAKPAWNPPGWVFGPVWAILYLSMAVAGWLVWRQRLVQNVRFAMTLFGIQLLLNLLWSGLFFALRNPALAFMDISCLWIAILVTTIAFWRIQQTAGILLLPYLAGVGFAAVLNFSIWQMNA